MFGLKDVLPLPSNFKAVPRVKSNMKALVRAKDNSNSDTNKEPLIQANPQKIIKSRTAQLSIHANDQSIDTPIVRSKDDAKSKSSATLQLPIHLKVLDQSKIKTTIPCTKTLRQANVVTKSAMIQSIVKPDDLSKGKQTFLLNILQGHFIRF